MPIQWLTAEAVVELNKAVLYEGENHALNPGSDLEGALNRPKGHYRYGDVNSIYKLAALYGIAIAKAHAFQDGNKRTALAAIRAFLRLNGFDFDFGTYEEAAAEWMIRIAEDDAELEDVAEWIQANTTGRD